MLMERAALANTGFEVFGLIAKPTLFFHLTFLLTSLSIRSEFRYLTRAFAVEEVFERRWRPLMWLMQELRFVSMLFYIMIPLTLPFS